MTPKEIFDKRYLYYRDMLNKPAIPLEARQLIFDVMEEYHQNKVNNVVLNNFSCCGNCDEAIVNELYCESCYDLANSRDNT
tara:strand:- start:52 stop:294 length:243 start_codon:yes stop_codon:yes gene_type:complete